MLEQLRRNSRSFIIWILFAMIIGAFVFTFGAQGQVSPSCSGTAPDTLMTIDDHEVSSRAWQFYMGVVGEGGSRPQRTQRVLDMVLQREILAMAAEDAGFRVTSEQIEDDLKQGYVYLAGARQDVRDAFFRNGVFDYEYLKRLVFNQWNMPSIELFIAQQERELLANAMAMLIMQSAAASPEEAMARFRHEQTQVTLDAVRFRPFQYRSAVERVLTDADVEAYLASHGDEVKAAYETDKDTKYKDVGLQVRVRQIRFNRAPDVPAEDGEQPAGDGGEAAPSGGASDASAAPSPGRVAADKALARLEAGADFAQLARELSQDAQTKNRGGDAGWRRKSAAGLGFPELTEALATLEKSAHSPVIETPGGFFILKVEDEREGDLSYDQVKHEIAAKLAVDYYAKENARRDAQAALATAKAEGKPLEELYEREATPTTPQFTPEQLQQLPPEIREMLLRQQLQQLQQLPGSEEGALGVETSDIPAAWADQPGEGAGGAGAPAATQPAPKPAPKDDAEPAAPPAGDAAAPEPPAEIPRPAPDDVPEPKVKRHSNIQRDAEGYVPGLGKSEEMVRALFDELEEGQLADQVFELDDGFAIVQLISRSEPNLADFEKNEDERVKYLGLERGQRTLQSWVQSRCRSLAEQGKIQVNPAIVAEVDDEGNQKPVQYSPCQTL